MIYSVTEYNKDGNNHGQFQVITSDFLKLSDWA